MKTFQEEFPELVENTQKVLKKFKSGKVDMAYVEMFFYTTIEMNAKERVAKADHEAAYRAANQMLDSTINMFAELEEYNLGQQFKQFLFEKYQREGKEAMPTTTDRSTDE